MLALHLSVVDYQILDDLLCPTLSWSKPTELGPPPLLCALHGGRFARFLVTTEKGTWDFLFLHAVLSKVIYGIVEALFIFEDQSGQGRLFF